MRLVLKIIIHYKLVNHYSHPVNDAIIPYNAVFNNCTFEIDEDYIGTEMFYKHVDLAHVEGIRFSGCDFILKNEGDRISEWNHGIAAYDAGFTVNAICDPLVMPCPESSYDRSTFTGFYSAINSVDDGSSPMPFTVRRADFINNACGIKIRKTDHVTVLQCNFEIGQHEGCGTGILSDGISGFTFEENNFTKYKSAPPANSFGIIVNESQASNTIYRNTFNGLSYANYADGKNWRDDSTNKGLLYLCNDNSDNHADFYVANCDKAHTSGIQSFQGDMTTPAGNTFSQNGAAWHFYNGGAHQITYYYNQNDSLQIPDPGLIDYVSKIGIDATNGCPSHYGNGSIVIDTVKIIEKEQDYYNAYANYNSVKSLYDSYVDGGSTQAEVASIKNAQPSDMWALRSRLLGHSPHLSQTVLMEAADRTDVLSESVLFEILAANPDELKKDTLISFLENKESPLPDYMVGILRQMAAGTTYKTVLQQYMSILSAAASLFKQENLLLTNKILHLNKRHKAMGKPNKFIHIASAGEADERGDRKYFSRK